MVRLSDPARENGQKEHTYCFERWECCGVASYGIVSCSVVATFHLQIKYALKSRKRFRSDTDTRHKHMILLHSSMYTYL